MQFCYAPPYVYNVNVKVRKRPLDRLEFQKSAVAVVNEWSKTTKVRDSFQTGIYHKIFVNLRPFI